MSLAGRTLPSIRYARGVLGELLFNWARRELWTGSWSPVADLPTPVIIADASPFLWRALETAAITEAPPSDEDRRLALVLTADSFLRHLPDAVLAVPKGAAVTITLPFCGQKLSLGTGCAQLVATQRARVAVASGDAALVDDSDAVRVGDNSQAGPRFVLTVSRDPRLFDDISRPQLVENPGRGVLDAFGVILLESLRLIQRADEDLHRTIASDVRCYALIEGTESIHNSFSVSALKGVVFLSRCRSRARLAEAIVHEHGHGELYTLANLDPLVRPDAEGVYYSPWRNDPRPLNGLFHALYVFEKVAGFLQQLSRNGTEALDIDIDERLTFIDLQLGVGIAQLVPDDFTPCGLQVVDMIVQSMHERGAGKHFGDRGKSMQRLREHSAAWCRNSGLERGAGDLDLLLSNAGRILEEGLRPARAAETLQ